MISSAIFRFGRVILPGSHYNLLFVRVCIIESLIGKRINRILPTTIMPKRKATQKTLTSFIKKSKDKDSEDDSNSVDSENEVVKEEKPEKPKRGGKNLKNEDSSKGNEPALKKGKTEGKPMNKTDTDYDSINFDCEKKSQEGKDWTFKISSWNIVSLKAVTAKNGMEFLKQESPDVMCFQETKCSEKKMPEAAKVPGYHRYFVSGDKEGYAGVALYSKTEPIKVDYGIGEKEFDNEGRVITAEYEKFYLVTAYVPNAGRGLTTLPKRMKWDPLFRDYLKKLDAKKPVILAGDLNVAHNEIDLKNPSTNQKSAGFTKEEREGFTTLLNEGFIDTFRNFYPDKEGAYTYWNYIGNARSRNTGWRLDYFVVSKRLLPNVCDNIIRNEVYGSDHCPITLFLSI